MIQSLTPPKTYSRFRPRHPHIWRSLCEIFKLTPNSLVVDVGCGPGNEACAFLESGCPASYVGVDNAEATIEAARVACTDAGAVTFVCCDATALPFDDDSVDVVTFFISLHQIAAPSYALAEARRVLRHDGYAAILVVPESAWANALEFEYFPSLSRIERKKSGDISTHTAEKMLIERGFRQIVTSTESYLVQHADDALLLAWKGKYFSTLTKLTQIEFEAGLERMGRELADGNFIKPRHITCELVWGRK